MQLVHDAPQLLSITLGGDPLHGDEDIFLRQLSTGVYTAITEKLKANSHAEEEEMSNLRFKSMILCMSLWKVIEGEEHPLFMEAANDYYKANAEEEDTPKTLKYKPGQYTQMLRRVTPDDFLAITDYFADQQVREWVEDTYDVTDKFLQPTNEKTKEALKNE